MISTSRLLLRPLSLADVPKLLILSGEEGMRRWIPDQVYRDERHAAEVVRILVEHTQRPPDPAARPYVLGVEHGETGLLIGHVGLSPARGSVEVGYAIEHRLQGQGLATEAVTAVSEWALSGLRLPEVLGVVAAANLQSCRVLEKSGFVRIGDEIKNVGGHPCPILVYRRARSERPPAA